MCNTCATLVKGVGNGKSYTCVKGENMSKSLFLLLNFAVNLKIVFETSRISSSDQGSFLVGPVPGSSQNQARRPSSEWQGKLGFIQEGK